MPRDPKRRLLSSNKQSPVSASVTDRALNGVTHTVNRYHNPGPAPVHVANLEQLGRRGRRKANHSLTTVLPSRKMQTVPDCCRRGGKIPCRRRGETFSKGVLDVDQRLSLFSILGFSISGGCRVFIPERRPADRFRSVEARCAHR